CRRSISCWRQQALWRWYPGRHRPGWWLWRWLWPERWSAWPKQGCYSQITEADQHHARGSGDPHSKASRQATADKGDAAAEDDPPQQRPGQDAENDQQLADEI